MEIFAKRRENTRHESAASGPSGRVSQIRWVGGGCWKLRSDGNVFFERMGTGRCACEEVNLLIQLQTRSCLGMGTEANSGFTWGKGGGGGGGRELGEGCHRMLLWAGKGGWLITSRGGGVSRGVGGGQGVETGKTASMPGPRSLLVLLVS